MLPEDVPRRDSPQSPRPGCPGYDSCPSSRQAWPVGRPHPTEVPRGLPIYPSCIVVLLLLAGIAVGVVVSDADAVAIGADLTRMAPWPPLVFEIELLPG